MYYQKIALAVSVCALVSALYGAAPRWTAEAREAIRHTFSRDAAIDVDNINGTIEIIGDNGTTMRVEGEKIIRAEDQMELDRAKREVTLDINEKDGVAQLYVNGPFRHHDGGGNDHGFHEREDRHYEVTYNLTVHVPHATELRLRDVNGTIRAGQTSGKFGISGVNGAVTMNSVAGTGSVRTVNGEINATFTESPKAPLEFKTVNGKIDTTFPGSLAADIRVKTLNGGAFTDFEAANLPDETTAKSGNRGNVFRLDKSKHLRIGNGGPELSFETVNGSISIRKGTAQ
ncbi:MAG TPA: DUF4097 family beta strand repeat-containing protein [Bryobacteraceae bacterium]|nr:DUF4097 family beta strand repeat-containing protein [Bryobacteraceae bacterium]